MMKYDLDHLYQNNRKRAKKEKTVLICELIFQAAILAILRLHKHSLQSWQAIKISISYYDLWRHRIFFRIEDIVFNGLCQLAVFCSAGHRCSACIIFYRRSYFSGSESGTFLRTFRNFFKLALLALASMYSSVSNADIFSAAADAKN